MESVASSPPSIYLFPWSVRMPKTLPRRRSGADTEQEHLGRRESTRGEYARIEGISRFRCFDAGGLACELL